MEFALTQESSLGLNQYPGTSNMLSEALEKYFKHRVYGSDVGSILINLVCVAPEFEAFFKTRKPKYKKGVGVIYHGSESIKIENMLRYDIKLDYNKVKNMNSNKIILYIKTSIIDSLSIIESFKLKSFSLEDFRNDLLSFFEAYII